MHSIDAAFENFGARDPALQPPIPEGDAEHRMGKSTWRIRYTYVYIKFHRECKSNARSRHVLTRIDVTKSE